MDEVIQGISGFEDIVIRKRNMNGHVNNIRRYIYIYIISAQRMN